MYILIFKVVSNYTPESSSDLPIIGKWTFWIDYLRYDKFTFFYISRIGTYYLFNIFLVSLSISLSVCVLNLHYRGHRTQPLPEFAKFLFFMENKYTEKPSEQNFPALKNMIMKDIEATGNGNLLNTIIRKKSEPRQRMFSNNSRKSVSNLRNGVTSSPPQFQHVTLENFKRNKDKKLHSKTVHCSSDIKLDEIINIFNRYDSFNAFYVK